MAADIEELKKKVLDYMAKKSKFKPKMYFKDLCKADENAKMRDVKKAASALVQEEKVEYWSSGSTTLYSLKGASAKEAATFHEEKEE